MGNRQHLGETLQNYRKWSNASFPRRPVIDGRKNETIWWFFLVGFSALKPLVRWTDEHIQLPNTFATLSEVLFWKKMDGESANPRSAGKHRWDRGEVVESLLQASSPQLAFAFIIIIRPQVVRVAQGSETLMAGTHYPCSPPVNTDSVYWPLVPFGRAGIPSIRAAGRCCLYRI